MCSHGLASSNFAVTLEPTGAMGTYSLLPEAIHVHEYYLLLPEAIHVLQEHVFLPTEARIPVPLLV